MNQHTKQRLVGAVVLVSLAVIFIPMLLDGGDESGMPVFGSNIPDKPDLKFEPLDIPLEPVTEIPESKPLLLEKAEPEQPAPVEKKAVEKAPAVKPSPTVAEKTRKPLVEKKAATESKLQPPSASKQPAVAWVIQVGSFSNSENALRLRDKLRAKDYRAYVEKLKSGSGTVYRVRIGPELKREEAESRLETLQKEMKIKGIVMGSDS